MEESPLEEERLLEEELLLQKAFLEEDRDWEEALLVFLHMLTRTSRWKIYKISQVALRFELLAVWSPMGDW